MQASSAAADSDAFIEYKAPIFDGPAFYSADKIAAGTALMDSDCRVSSYTSCLLDHVSVGSQSWIAAYSYVNSNGNPGYAHEIGTMVYGCSVPGTLFVTSGSTVWGPYDNHYLGVPTWGTAVCRGVDKDPESRTERQTELGNGECGTRPTVGNPINVGVGNKFQEIADVPRTAHSALNWSRFYNSGIALDTSDNEAESAYTVPATARLGSRWRGTYDRSLVDLADKMTVRLLRHTGERIDFVEERGKYKSVADPRGLLTRASSGWVYRAIDGGVERYDAQGRLIDIDPGTSSHIHLQYDGALVAATDTQGRSLQFEYDEAGRLENVRDGTGVVVSYAYSDRIDRKADLVEATYADGRSHRYTYNEPSYVDAPLPHALTGIFDETAKRFASFRYDASGRAVSSEHNNGTDRVTLARAADGSVSVAGPTNAVHGYRYAEVRGVRRLVGVDQPGGAGCGAAFSKLEYDDGGNLARSTDFDGRVTEYTYDADGRETSQTEAVGTPLARTTRTDWHASLMRPTRISLPGQEERLTYDDAGNLTRRELWAAIDPSQNDAPLTLSRTWKFTYDADGRLIQEEGPRSDVSGMAVLNRYTYRTASAANCVPNGACDYRKGDLATVENALGQRTDVLRLDAAGRIFSHREPNGTVVDNTYNARGWQLSARETRTDGVVATTSFTYDERGDVASITDADGVTVQFEYDAAGRMVRMSNPSNHRLVLDLDKSGRPVTETTYDQFFQKTQVKRTFDALGRLATEQGDGAGLVSFTYDEVGRPTGTTDGDSRRDASTYDALGRLRESIDDLDGRKAAVTVTHDPLDQVKSITDPDGVTTRYLATGMGDLSHVDSPDGGEAYDEYDATGLVVRHEGAGGVGSFNVTRDALSRPLKITYADPALNATFTYDVPGATCSGDHRNGIGRLSTMSTARSETAYCYDAEGNVSRKTQRWDTTQTSVTYAYTKAGRLASTGLDGTANTTYRYDVDGKINGVTVDVGGSRKELITKVAYRPFDSIENWTYGNDRTLSITRDKAGRVTGWGGIDPEGSNYWLDTSPGGRFRADVARGYAYAFGQDGLDYLNEVRDYNTGKSLLAFDYNASGDRLAVRGGGASNGYGYQAGTHRLTQADGKARRYDDAGNLIVLGDATLSYDATGRLASASEGGKLLVSYGYDAEGNRIARTVTSSGKTTMTVQDEAGRWLADVDASGRVLQQGVWMDDLLVGVVADGKLYYVAPDHLGSPREILDPERNAIVWRGLHNADPFGSTLPDEDPDGDGMAFVFDLRFPGQRYDNLTGLHANGARDYDPTTGRYIQVDPIGLGGGVNPYLYANGSPLTYSDPDGEIGIVGAILGAAFEIGMQAYGNYRQGCGVLNLRNYNLKHVAISAAAGAVSPGLLAVGRRVVTSGRALRTLNAQLATARTPNRITKLQVRITDHHTKIREVAVPQASFTGIKTAGKKLTETSGSCECSQ
ncbi:RHS repeat-associated core domain-containing protein [Luteibacter pinisoli]|nr:RHS repeat-associated core domain-containing protein [Luteibacter pinisoli]